MKKLLFLIGLWTLAALPVQSQELVPAHAIYNRGDSLRGTLTPLRTCYDIEYYHLEVKVDPDERWISGSNLFRFTATETFDRLQFDLFDNLRVDKILFQGHELPFTRSYHAVFVTFPHPVEAGTREEFQVFYSGNPVQARRAPWDGGFDFQKDSNGHHWIATACQKLGASAWWPNKDHQSDEVDSMLISISVPTGLINVSNGRFRGSEELEGGYTRFDWFVSSPINNYNVAINIGDYVHMTSRYAGESGELDLDYWVLREHADHAFAYLDPQVVSMLEAFEYWFGPYPFYRDGYKLVETAHLGMEHQSAIAYGNQYQFGYLGRDLSGTGWGLKWDFIIVHESGHEWFGNNITSNDLADMWIHEAFTNYSESLYLDYHFGKRAGQEYLYGNRAAIRNDRPLQGDYHVNRAGSGDMYNKGGVLLHMVRTLIDDDDRWRQILRGLNARFFHSTVDYEDIVGYLCAESGLDLWPVFEQYVKHATLPILEFVFKDTPDGSQSATCRWVSPVEGFNMPVRIRATRGENPFQVIHPSTQFSPVDIAGLTRSNLEVDTFNYYIDLQIR